MSTVEMIKQWIEEDGLTYSEVARRVGWTRSNFNHKIHGGRNLNFSTVKRIAEALGRELVITRIPDAQEDGNCEELCQVTEKQRVSYDVVKSIYESAGYDIAFQKTQCPE